MVTKFIFFPLILFTFLMTIPAVSQTNPNTERTIKKIPQIKMETVGGERLQLGDVTKNVTILFLLSKPSSMSKGKTLMEDVRRWTKALKEKYRKCAYSVLIVEPIKTSFPFYNIQKGKLKDESFPVVIDKEGKVLEDFGIVESDKLSVIITDGAFNTMQLDSADFNRINKNKIADEVEKLISRLEDGDKCYDS